MADPPRFGTSRKAWTEFLTEWHSGFQAPASIRDTLRRRLNNLLDRGLIERERAKYTVTDDGLSYLDRTAPPPRPATDDPETRQGAEGGCSRVPS